MEYVIYNAKESLFWSNNLGWCLFDDATRYNVEERNTFTFLPGTGSTWLNVNEVTEEMKNQEN